MEDTKAMSMEDGSATNIIKEVLFYNKNKQDLHKKIQQEMEDRMYSFQPQPQAEITSPSNTSEEI